MARILLISLIIISFLSSCKENKVQNNTPVNINNSRVSDIEPQENAEKPQIKKRFIDEDRAMAKSEIDVFFKNKAKPVSFLSSDYFIVDYISDGKNGPKDMIDFGEWYKFEGNFEYQHGFFKEIKDKGKYSYDSEDKILLMLPDDEKAFPSEWKILNSGDIVVLVGTAKFGNNPLQKHMQNVKEKPLIKK